jgi:hypothetical protein
LERAWIVSLLGSQHFITAEITTLTRLRKPSAWQAERRYRESRAPAKRDFNLDEQAVFLPSFRL